MDVREYTTATGRVPFQDWLVGLKDSRIRNAIVARILRLSDGSFGDWKAVGHGLIELPIHRGPGLRIYCGRRGAQLIIILAGGDKSTQRADIEKAHDYWKDYQARR